MVETVLRDIAQGVCTLTLNRPEKLNALNYEMLNELRQGLASALDDSDVGAIVLQGAGNVFCSGDDLDEFDEWASNESKALELIECIQDIARQLVLGEKVTICTVHGWAVGSGLRLAINSDLAIFGEYTRCVFPEFSLGFFPTGGITALLPRTIGHVQTKEAMLLGETFGANDALKMGIAWKVVSRSIVHETAQEAAKQIAALPQQAVADFKRVSNQINLSDFEQLLSLEKESALRAMLDPITHKRVRESRSQ